MKKRMITIVKAILSALNAEGGMAMLSLLFWGGLALFGAVNLVVSPYSLDIGMFAGTSSIYPKLALFLLIIGIPSVLMFGMFAYMWGIMEMMYTYRRVMTACIVYDSTGESITITTNNKKGVIERMKHIIKNILGIIVVLGAVGCGDAEHGMRMKALNDDGYPGYCQRDTNQDGWHTLEEGAAVLYKDLGPCPTCKAAGIVPVYNSSTDTTWSADAQWNKQELAYNTFPYHVCDMSAQEWDSYRLMKWDYAYTIWWRGSLMGLEKLTHTEVREECTSKRMQYELEWRLLEKKNKVDAVPVEQTYKGSTVFPLFPCMFTMAILTLRRRFRFTSLGYWLSRPGSKEQCEVKVQGDPHEDNHGWIVKAVGFRHKGDVPAQWLHIELASTTSQKDMEHQAKCFNEWADPGVGNANHYTRCCVSLDEAVTMTGAMMISYSWGEADGMVDNLKHIDILKIVAKKTFLPDGQTMKARHRIECLKQDRRGITKVLDNKQDMPILQLSS